MPNERRSLEQLRVVNPCPKTWDDLKGDERKRYCGQCEKHVHNLSAMTTHEVERLFHQTGGELCVHYLPTSEGMPMTLNQRPVADRFRLKLARALAVAAGIAFVACGPAHAWPSWSSRLKALKDPSQLAQKGSNVKAVKQAVDKLTPKGKTGEVPAPAVLGDIAIVAPQGNTGGASAPRITGRIAMPPQKRGGKD